MLVQNMISREDSFAMRNIVATDLYELLKQYKLSVDCIEPCETGVRISISWGGDWKHDHWRLRYILAENGYDYAGDVITEEDGSDCYSADHYIRVF